MAFTKQCFKEDLWGSLKPTACKTVCIEYPFEGSKQKPPGLPSLVSQSSVTRKKLSLTRHLFPLAVAGDHGSLGLQIETWWGLIIANVAVFMLWRIADPKFMTKHFTISLDNLKSGRVHTLITSAFSHAEIGHLVSNMVALYIFGMMNGSLFGPKVLLKLYFDGAVLGSLLYLLDHSMALSFKGQGLFGMDPLGTPGLGASGAVNAIIFLDIFLFSTSLCFGSLIPVPAILLGILLMGKDMLRISEGDSEITPAHLWGAVFAAISMGVPINRRF